MITSILGFMHNDAILKHIFSNYGDRISPYFSQSEFLILLLTIEMINLVMSLINFFCVIGLLFKNKHVWKFAVYYNLILSWTIIGLTIACALNEKSVKKIIKF